MRRVPLLAVALAALAAAPALGQVAPPLAPGILIDELPLAARPAAKPAPRAAPSIAGAAPSVAPPAAVEVAPGTTLAPGFLGSRPADAPLDGPAGGSQRGLGERLLDAGPGVVLQRRF